MVKRPSTNQFKDKPFDSFDFTQDKFARGKKVAVVGLGVEGFSSALWLSKHGAFVTVLDVKEEREFSKEEIRRLRDKDIKLKTGKNYLDNLSDYDYIFRSPGIRLDSLQPKTYNLKPGVIISQTKLFFELCPCPIIGITGTKGKGTTASLIYEMLKIQSFDSAQDKRFDAYLGGNIGHPPLDFLDKLTDQSVVVLELSSFQLTDLDHSPQIAVILMITSEHLDYHQDTREYVEAKRNLLKYQTALDAAIINRDYRASNESDIHTEGKVYRVSTERECEEGCFIKSDKVVLKYQISNIKYQIIDIIKTSEVLLPGRHNLENVCAAVMAAYLSGVSIENMRKALRGFKGLEHRLELVATVNGAKYYDDSFSTTPETAIAAIEAFKEPEILILGGSSKGSDFSELGKVISQSKNIKAVIGIGAEWTRIKSMIYDSRFKIFEDCKNMGEIVHLAAKIAEAGDVVLLSPACASFDMFRNYKERGELFRQEVLKLQA